MSPHSATLSPLCAADSMADGTAHLSALGIILGCTQSGRYRALSNKRNLTFLFKQTSHITGHFKKCMRTTSSIQVVQSRQLGSPELKLALRNSLKQHKLRHHPVRAKTV